MSFRKNTVTSTLQQLVDTDYTSWRTILEEGLQPLTATNAFQLSGQVHDLFSIPSDLRFLPARFMPLLEKLSRRFQVETSEQLGVKPPKEQEVRLGEVSLDNLDDYEDPWVCMEHALAVAKVGQHLGFQVGAILLYDPRDNLSELDAGHIVTTLKHPEKKTVYVSDNNFPRAFTKRTWAEHRLEKDLLKGIDRQPGKHVRKGMTALDCAYMDTLGILFYQRGMPRNSEKAHRRAISLDEGNASAHLNLSNSLYWKGRSLKTRRWFEEGVREAEKAIAINPSAGSYRLLGDHLRRLERWGDACEAYATTIALHPEEHNAIAGLYKVFKAQGREKDAEVMRGRYGKIVAMKKARGKRR